MAFKFATLATAISLAGGATTAHAAAFEDRFNVRGYGTLGVATTGLRPGRQPEW